MVAAGGLAAFPCGGHMCHLQAGRRHGRVDEERLRIRTKPDLQIKCGMYEYDVIIIIASACGMYEYDVIIIIAPA